MSRLFQINENDLAELERLLPEMAIMISESHRYDNRARTILRVVQRIMTDVRWDYGPPGEVVEVRTEVT